jgi:hypothetical protein
MSDLIVPHTSESRGYNIIKLLREHKPNIVILGTGAHYMYQMADEEFHDWKSDSFMEYFFPRFRIDLRRLRKNGLEDDHKYRPDYIVFRTNNPGHQHCMLFHRKPVANWTSEFLKLNNGNDADKYKWYIHEYMNYIFNQTIAFIY